MRFICSILAIALVSCCFAAEEATKLPHDAQAALDGYNKAVAKIQEDAAHKVNGEREKVYTTLDRSCKDAAKKGDVDGAIAIKAEMKKLLEQAQKDDDTDMLGQSTDPTKMVVGAWHVTRTDGHDAKWTFTDDGHVTCLEKTGHTFGGTWKAEDKNVRIVWAGDATKWELFTAFSQDKLVGDGWNTGKNTVKAERWAEPKK